MPTPLLNSRPVTVCFRDGRPEATVELHELSIRELYRWIEHYNRRDTPAMVALCCHQPPEWVDLLTDESFGELARATFDLNFQRATALAMKDATVAALMRTGLLEIAQLADDGPLSPAKSPAPAASASAAANGSA